jgi:hypothetical protein
MNSLFKIVAVNLLVVIVLLLFAEAVSLTILKGKYHRNFDSSIIQTKKYFDSDGLKANATSNVWGKHFSTDEFGFRKTARPFNKKKKTWLFIGDSVTQGVGVDDSSNFVSLIASSIDTANVLNCSMIGWSIHDYKNAIFSLLTDTTLSLNISRITIGWCMNDVYGKSKTNDLPAVGNKGWKSAVSGMLQKHYATYRLVKLYATQNSSHYYHYDKQFYSPQHPLAISAASTIDSIYDFCSKRGVNVEMLSFPYRTEIGNETKVNPTLHNNISSLLPAINNASEALSPKDLYLFSDEIHYSSLGHHIIASVILAKE